MAAIWFARVVEAAHSLMHTQEHARVALISTETVKHAQVISLDAHLVSQALMVWATT